MIKKGEKIVIRFFYGLFLSNMASIAPTIAIAMIIAIVEIAKYISVGGRAETGRGDVVDAASHTYAKVSAEELPYDLDPLKDAIILYCPGTSGVVQE